MPPGVNFSNILLVAFAPKSFCQKLQTQIVSIEKLCKKLSYGKAAHKVLVKLTPGGKITLPLSYSGSPIQHKIFHLHTNIIFVRKPAKCQLVRILNKVELCSVYTVFGFKQLTNIFFLSEKPLKGQLVRSEN